MSVLVSTSLALSTLDASQTAVHGDIFVPLGCFDVMYDSKIPDVVSINANASPSTVDILANVVASVEEIPYGSDIPHPSREDESSSGSASPVVESDTVDSTTN